MSGLGARRLAATGRRDRGSARRDLTRGFDQRRPAEGIR
jgi:hypothetical protein